MANDTETFRKRAREDHGLRIDVQEFPEGAATAEDAAAAIGCELGQIASSLAFLADQLVVVVTSGANTVDTRTLATLRGVHTAEMGDPDDVEEVLGYSVGGVPPFGHDTQVPVYVDETLTEFETVWAAAGSSDAVFPIDPERLVEIADAIVADVVE
jgi:Cys-tRNA(Pro) deacylase